MARTTVARSERRRMSPMRRREELMGYLLLLPFIIGFVGLWAGPVIASFVLSFFDYNVLRGGEFIGLKNYQLMFFDDWRFWHSLRITFSYVGVVVPASVIIGYIWALALNQQVKGLSFFRTAFYMPSIVPQIASAYLFWWLLNSQVGLVNAGLDAIGIDGPDWFFSTQWALPALYIMGLWTVGGNILLYLAAFQGVPSDLYDAAKVDGANVFQRFWNVTIPLTSPVIFFTFIIGMIINLQTFTGAFVITREDQPRLRCSTYSICTRTDGSISRWATRRVLPGYSSSSSSCLRGSHSRPLRVGSTTRVLSGKKVLPEPEPWHESMSRTPVQDRRLPSRPRVLQFTCPQEPRVGPALEPSQMVVIPARTGDTIHYRPGNGCRESNARPVGLGLVPSQGHGRQAATGMSDRYENRRSSSLSLVIRGIPSSFRPLDSSFRRKPESRGKGGTNHTQTLPTTKSHFHTLVCRRQPA